MIPSGMTVQTEHIQDTMTYDGKEVLTFSIAYPRFSSDRFGLAATILNPYYQLKAAKFARYCRNRLYQGAVEQYQFATANGYPVMIHQAVATFTVTYNQNCALSLYQDSYIFSGGAHGNTTRRADTWDLQNARRILLSQVIRREDWQAYAQDAVIRQIEAQMQSGDAYYFDEYEKNVRDTFDPDRFYLTPDGVILYFGQYDIAPYASGMPTFLLRYGKHGVVQPRC